MKRYKDYRDSSVEWIGCIPKGWQCVALKHVSTIQNGSTPSSSEDKYWDGDVNWVTTDDLGKLKDRLIVNTRRTITKEGYESCGTRMASKGSVVISTRAPIGHIGILDIQACTNQGCKTVIPTAINNVYCYYFLKHARPFLESLGEGSTFKELPTGTLKSFYIPVPTIEEQTQIAQYLDHKTTQIDKLITDKEKLIELLNEERTAIINQSVTKGLNPDGPMKDSGVEWIGKIPNHWELKRLKFIGSAFGGLTYAPNNVVEENEGTLVLRSSNIQNGELSLKDNVYVNSKIPVKLTLKRGDILICSRNGSKNLIGKNICIDKDMEGSTFGAFMMIFRSPNWKFLKHYFNSSIFTSQSALFLTATINQLTTSTLNNFWIALPNSSTEQNEISRFIDDKNREIDLIKKNAQQEIRLLKEYKTALISEVVTGKVDVRDEVIAESTELVS
ncbi:restriction endonuclease subunit S [Pedobacter sp. P351]|uniref:restriction endonuclease subunit S n=1 Tax=Pedobacter superstes TaxID=3133441 RepID=UPI0030B1A146